MYREIAEILRCPVCQAAFRLEEMEVVNGEVVEGAVICPEGHRYPIRRGVLDFGSKEQENTNQWSEYYQETDYEAYDRKIQDNKTDREKAQQKLVIDAVLSEASKLDKGYIVDIASGRGMLLTQLAQAVNPSVHIIATDLSFEVLMYDRLKINKLNPNARVSYIACDATAMPLKPDVSDLTVSFFGVANMIGTVEAGIREASRVTKPDGSFLNAFVLIREDSEGYAQVKKLCAESGLARAERVYLEGYITELHSRFFPNVSCNVICEDIKEDWENYLDLLPYPGEWFANVIFACKK